MPLPEDEREYLDRRAVFLPLHPGLAPYLEQKIELVQVWRELLLIPEYRAETFADIHRVQDAWEDLAMFDELGAFELIEEALAGARRRM